ncbi:uncharacterized protein [Lepeophtheirus salmonis]|uniref:Uncharacterized protein n=1 Tax=Lepeophtheirus salmonis TaxID=72036 RepID=A0A0K2U4P7_LEPSM|nr:uncharacterized protein LOC121116482 isoform X1 [Lepeophtheirus salmonis]XP_040566670.1 uncharacterized protein LOC121116482 isoform X1 [Lepeophtheirus salmonis]XP_040566671.1 uncharacterized protein LOC121116482 isoform X1 [Lepeophtheirus salmonis]
MTSRTTSASRGRTLLTLFTISFLLSSLVPSGVAGAEHGEPTDLVSPRTSSVTLNSNSNIWFNVIVLAPILLIIIFLDFAIFGAIANRSDDLNPVSRLFFHAREGLSNIKNRQAAKRYNRHRYTRSANLAGPLLDSLAKAHQKYEEEEE